MRVLLVMLGARRRYLVPEVMEELGVLGRFITDIFVGKFRSLPVLLNAVGRGLNAKGLRALASRDSRRLPKRRVVAFQWLGLRYALTNRRRNVADAEWFASINRRFCQKSVPYLPGSDVCWAYNGAALEVFEAARAKNIRCVLEQVIAPRDTERQAVACAAKDWPGWAACPTKADAGQNDRLAEREEAEWRLADIIVAGSPYVRKCLAEAGVPEARCMVVPSGIDLETFPVGPALPHHGPLRVLFVGHISLRKGAPYLLEAARRLNSRAIHVKMVGSPLVRQACLDEFNSYAEFLGSVPPEDMPRLYHAADVLVMPSVCEGSAMVTYEARSCGIPVVATPNAGAAFCPGVDGLHIPVRDVNAIATALERLASDRRELRQLRQGAIAHRAALGRQAYRERIRTVLQRVMQRDQHLALRDG